MAEQLTAAKKKNAALANSDKSRANEGYLVISHTAATSVKLSKMDELLEQTLSRKSDPVESLTSREAEILQLIVVGKTDKQIAKALCRTERTIEYHRNRIMRKLDVHNAVDLVKRAIDGGIAL